MRFVHSREYLKDDDIVLVQCSHQCNVRVMSDREFQNFKAGKPHKYHGGHFKKLPAQIPVPHNGFWNTTIDLGGSPSAFNYSVSYMK